MQNLIVRRYANPKSVGWAGWIEPADKSWIAFIGLDGRPLFFLNRDTETGGILPDDPAERAAHLAMLKAEGGGRIGMHADGTADYSPGKDPHVPGEAIHPLGISGSGGDVEPLK